MACGKIRLKAGTGAATLLDSAIRNLAYHEFAETESKDVYCLTPELFRASLSLLKSRSLLHRVGISFDDAHRSQMDCALPVMEEFGLKGLFFVTTDWVEKRSGIATWDDLRAVVLAGHAIGSHGHTHALLTQCPGERLRQEVTKSRAMLEDRLNIEVRDISMPGGRWSPRIVEACLAAGYTTLYTSQPGRPVEAVHRDGAMSIVGRLIVRRTMSAAMLARYARNAPLTALRLQSEYLLKTAAKQAIGDAAYQALWRRLLRKPLAEVHVGTRLRVPGHGRAEGVEEL
jgi:peptidoglycan/xylan/chitin deacetylase (PgdA/CDA1 family)